MGQKTTDWFTTAVVSLEHTGALLKTSPALLLEDEVLITEQGYEIRASAR